MAYRHATYKEYIKASKYAKFRYKFGVYIQIISAILLIYLLYYTITNIEEMKANPIDYAEEKMGAVCLPKILPTQPVYNGNYRSEENFGEW